jgi:alpha-glucosidase (family GH31 glycosyl hydrolase)
MAAKMAITSSENQDLEAGKALPEQEFALIGLQNQDPVQENIIRKFLKLRYRLLPYIYTFAHENYETGMPICRPMLLAFQNDPNCNKDQWPRQYMFGKELLVAPVCEDTSSMDVYLPSGHQWIDYWTDQVYDGGQVIHVDTTDLSIMPLFVRAGSIIPMQKECCWVDHEDTLEPLYLDIYPSHDCGFTLYEDDCHSLAYQNGNFALTEIRCVKNKDSVTIALSPTAGEYTGKPALRTVIATIHGAHPQTTQFTVNTAETTSITLSLT